MKLITAVMLTLVILAAAPALADTLTFPNNICSAFSDGSGGFVACADYGYINQSYGDTALVDVQYVDNVNPSISMRWWNADYNNLIGVTWGGTGDCPGCSNNSILLIPTAGYQVTLNSFDMGAYSHAVRDTHIVIYEYGTNAVLFNYGTQTIGVGDVFDSFFPGVTSSLGIVINFYDSGYNDGIDNIDFTLAPVGVPEPGSLVLLGSGLLMAAAGLRRMRPR